ncbi:MAG: (d)CMP kinase [Pirellulales bacterium]
MQNLPDGQPRRTRARRRQSELEARGETVDYAELLAEQNLRDQRDRDRAVGPLAQAGDAILISTDGLSFEQVVDKLEQVVRRKLQPA